MSSGRGNRGFQKRGWQTWVSKEDDVQMPQSPELPAVAHVAGVGDQKVARA